MSFLLGLPATEADTVSPALRARGINMLRVSPYELASYAVVARQQALYKPYLSHLPHYMLAYCTQSKVDCGVPFVPCKFPTDRILPFPLPGLSISYNGAVPTETLDMLKEIGYQELTVQKKKTLVLPVITREQARKIAATSPITTTPTVQNTINLSGLGAYTLVLRLISNLLHAHHYPAFQTDDTAVDVTVSVDMVGTAKRKGLGEGSSRGKRMRTDDGTPGQEDEEMQDELETEDMSPAQKLGHWNAIPPPRTTIAWGSLTDLPAGSGVYVPFIRELSQPDKQTITHFIRDYLVQSIGSSVQGISQSMDAIRALMGNFATTEVGHQLAHLVTCIRLALQAQACAFPLFDDGVYEGCVIRGCQFTIIAGSQITKPVDDEHLRRVIDTYGTHSSARNAIAAVLQETVDDAFKVSWRGEDVEVTSMYLLRVRLSGVQLSQQDRDEVVKAASHLRFGPSSGCSPGSVDAHIRLLYADPDDDRLRNLPIHPTALFSPDWVYVVWSSFGRLAPSPWYGNAPAFDLTKQPRPTRMFWELRALEEAVADMKKVQSSCRITVPVHKRKSSVYREMEWNSRQIKDILQALTRWTTGVDEVTGTQTAIVGGILPGATDDGLFDI